jgi:inorganic pyrophosphatase
MSIYALLEMKGKLELQAYKKPRDPKSLSKSNVAFSGSPQKHPYDSSKVCLITDPLSSNTFYYEFNKKDISYIEELPNLVDLDGDTVTMGRIWIKKSSLGIRCTPFIVEDTRE